MPNGEGKRRRGVRRRGFRRGRCARGLEKLWLGQRASSHVIRMQQSLGCRCVLIAVGFSATIGVLVFFFGAQETAPPENLPSRLSDREFWRMVSDFSEPDGFFRSDNFVSNETTFQHVIPELTRRTKPGGV